jgi:ParB family chromosome partitioning protein
MDNGRLGKGLDQLLGDDDTPDTPKPDPALEDARLQKVPLDRISPNPHQPRDTFDPEELEGLVRSIREEGVLQPVLLTPDGNDAYTLAAGERRFRAAKKANLDEIPAVVQELDDQRMLEVALVENVQRENLNPIEKARGLDRLYNNFDLSLDEIADMTGSSPSSISNTRRLLELPEDLQELIGEGALTSGHARALLSLDHPDRQRDAAQKVIQKDLSVRNTEKLVQNLLQTGESDDTDTSNDTLPPDLQAIQEQLEERVGTRVRIKNHKKGGAIQIKYSSDDELNAILKRLDV